MPTDKQLRDAIIEHDLTDPNVPLPTSLTSVLYAETGKRKTTTACSMVLERGCLISADNSWWVLEKPEHEELRKKVKLIVYDSISQLNYIDYDKYDTVILDTQTAMVDRYLDLLMEKASWPSAKYREALVTTDKHPDLKGVTNRGQPDYLVTRDKWRPIIEMLCRQIPAHVIFTMHVNIPSPMPGADLTRRPRLPQATWQVIAEFANIIGYIVAKGSGFSIQMSESSGGYIGKSQVRGISGTMPLDQFVMKYREAAMEGR